MIADRSTEATFLSSSVDDPVITRPGFPETGDYLAECW